MWLCMRCHRLLCIWSIGRRVNNNRAYIPTLVPHTQHSNITLSNHFRLKPGWIGCVLFIVALIVGTEVSFTAHSHRPRIFSVFHRIFRSHTTRNSIEDFYFGISVKTVFFHIAQTIRLKRHLVSIAFVLPLRIAVVVNDLNMCLWVWIGS